MPEESPTKKKINILLSLDLIHKIEETGISKTEAITEALKLYFSEDKIKTEEYKKKIQEYERKNLILEAKLTEFDNLKIELERVHALLDDQRELSKAHVSQVQTLITHMENERRSKEEIIHQKEEKILLLEDGQKRKWWMFWK